MSPAGGVCGDGRGVGTPRYGGANCSMWRRHAPAPPTPPVRTIHGCSAGSCRWFGSTIGSGSKSHRASACRRPVSESREKWTVANGDGGAMAPQNRPGPRSSIHACAAMAFQRFGGRRSASPANCGRGTKYTDQIRIGAELRLRTAASSHVSHGPPPLRTTTSHSNGGLGPRGTDAAAERAGVVTVRAGTALEYGCLDPAGALLLVQ